jgi:hypothetical protein
MLCRCNRLDRGTMVGVSQCILSFRISVLLMLDVSDWRVSDHWRDAGGPNPEISDSALQLRMVEEELNRTQVAGLAINLGDLRTSHRSQGDDLESRLQGRVVSVSQDAIASYHSTVVCKR